MDGIKTFATNRLTWLSVAYVIIFAVLAAIGGVGTTAEITRVATTTLALIGMIAYGVAAVSAYQAHRWPNPDLIASLGAFLLMMGIGWSGMFQILWRLSDFSRWAVNNHVYNFAVSLIGLGIFILVAVTNVVGSDMPLWTRVRIIFAWCAAAVTTIGLVVISPDLRPLADFLMPWVTSWEPWGRLIGL